MLAISLSFLPVFLAADLAHGDAITEATASLSAGEALVVDLTIQNNEAILAVTEANNQVILAEESLDLAEADVEEKQLAVDAATVAYDESLITEIVYTDGSLSATVYNNLGYNASPPIPTDSQIVSVQEVANINFQWGAGPVMGGPSEDVVVKFSGTITAEETGEYQFYGPADDGFILRINGVTVINDWVDKGGGGSISEPLVLIEGEANTFEAWYYENGGGAWVQLYWNPGGAWEIVPPTAFDTAVVVESKDEGLLLELQAAEESLSVSQEALFIAQNSLSQAISTYNAASESQAIIYNQLQDAINAIPSLQKALADAIEAAKPIPQPEPTPEPTPEKTPDIIEPTPEPTEEPVEPQPTPEPEPQPTIPSEEEPTPEPSPSEEPSKEPEEAEPSPLPKPEPTETPEPREPELSVEESISLVEEASSLNPDELSDAQVEQLIEAALVVFESAEQGSPEYEAALDALMVAAQADDLELPEELAAIPLIGDVAGAALEVFNAVGNIGADMSPQVREDAEKTIIASVIAAQAAIGAVATATTTTTASSGTRRI